MRRSYGMEPWKSPDHLWCLETWLAVINPVNAFQGFLATGKLAAGAAGIGLFFTFWS